MDFKQILILIISVLALFFGHRYYKNDFCPTCCVESTTAVATTSAPLLFNWDNEEPITDAGFDELKVGMLAGMNSNNVLEITGEYFADETNDTEHSNLGIARATEVGELLKLENPDLKYIALGTLVDEREGVRTNKFEGISYDWKEARDDKEMTIEISDTNDAKILFPFNSTDRIESQEVSNYLTSVANRLNDNSDLKAYIVGYTDNIGEPGANRRLSERRAKKIRDILKKQGVAHKQIVPSGRGEADSIASNGTEEGRQLNRRVEITIK